MIKIDSVLKKKLYAAFDALAQREANEFSQAELDAISFTPAFELRIQKLFRRYDYFWYHWFGNRAKRVAAIIILAIGITFGTTLSVEALREPFLSFVVETFERFTKIIFHDTNNDTPADQMIPLEPIDPKYIPEGYELVLEQVGFSSNLKEYYNGESKIGYRQSFKDGWQAYLDTEDAEFQKFDLNGIEAVYVTENNETTVFFTDENYAYTILGTAPKEELIEMAKSVLN